MPFLGPAFVLRYSFIVFSKFLFCMALNFVVQRPWEEVGRIMTILSVRLTDASDYSLTSSQVVL